MDSEDDCSYVSDGEDYYGSEGGGSAFDDDDDDEVCLSYVDKNGDEKIFRNEVRYTVLSEEDIQKRQEDDIREICTVLSVSSVEACILLGHFNWRIGNVQEAWFADEEKIRESLGLLEKPVVNYSMGIKLTCRICFEKFRRRSMHASCCGHPFCNSCWKSYITTSITDGPGCLTLRCPAYLCRAAVGQDMVNLLGSDKEKEKYSHYLIRSYVESSRNTKWCPERDCKYAVEFVLGSESYDVSCNCAHTFCWNCVEESHRPVDCDPVAKWVLKNSSEAENTNWILANSKPCPKCNRAIQKNQGCMHMTCTPPCRFEFCWLCLGSWSAHSEKTGGSYACNQYAKAKKEGTYNKAEETRKMAKRAVERYTHYYERWIANHLSRKKAIADLKKMQDVDIKKLSDIQSEPEGMLKFITDAWIQIIECRRVLKWTYAYGYYLPKREFVRTKFFEYVQGEAESALERLHQCAEKDLEVHLKGPSEDFNEFRSKLVGLTIVTRNYFENLVQALANGLADVASPGAPRKSDGGIESSTATRFVEVEVEVEDWFENSCLALMLKFDIDGDDNC